MPERFARIKNTLQAIFSLAPNPNLWDKGNTETQQGKADNMTTLRTIAYSYRKEQKAKAAKEPKRNRYGWKAARAQARKNKASAHDAARG